MRAISLRENKSVNPRRFHFKIVDINLPFCLPFWSAYLCCLVDRCPVLLSRDCHVSQVNLHEQGLLLRQAEFVVGHGRKRCLRHVFLFEELVVFSKTRHSPAGHDVYLYKHSIKVRTFVDTPLDIFPLR